MDESCEFTTGVNHMDPAHNTLFSIFVPTEQGSDNENFFSVTGALTSELGGATVLVPMDMSSDLSTESRRLEYDPSSFATSTDSSATGTDFAEGAPEGSALLISSALGVGTSTSPPDGADDLRGIIIGFFSRNEMANSALEKRASYIKSRIDGDRAPEFSYPAVICKTEAEYDAVEKLFSGKSLDKVDSELEAVEKALENWYANHEGEQAGL